MEGIKIYTDGSSLGNPGKSSYSFIILKDGKIIIKKKGELGIKTNNQAEYIAVIEALKEALRNGFKNVDIYSDSLLLINQINGKYKVKSENIKNLFMEINRLKERFESISFNYISRDNEFLKLVHKEAKNKK